MTEAPTVKVTLSLTKEAHDMLHAFCVARNGSLNNQADSAIKTGITYLIDQAPLSFKGRYIAAMGDIKESKDE